MGSPPQSVDQCDWKVGLYIQPLGRVGGLGQHTWPLLSQPLALSLVSGWTFLFFLLTVGAGGAAQTSHHSPGSVCGGVRPSVRRHASSHFRLSPAVRGRLRSRERERERAGGRSLFSFFALHGHAAHNSRRDARQQLRNRRLNVRRSGGAQADRRREESGHKGELIKKKEKAR